VRGAAGGVLRAARRLAIPTYLVGLAIYVLAGTRAVPFHGDESTLIHASRDYFDQFVAGDLPRVMNRSGDDPADQRLRLLDGRVQKYLGALAYHLAGGSAEGINGPWHWGAGWKANVDRGNLPRPKLLMAQRWAMALLLALSIPVAYAVGAQLGAEAGGLLMATLLASSPNLLVNGRRAMMEAPLLLFTLVTVLAALRFAIRPSHGWTALLGLGAGATVASKHSGVFAVALLFSALGLLSLARRDSLALVRVVLAGLVGVAVFLALNPAWWPAPLDAAREVLRLRSEMLAEQTRYYGGYADARQQALGALRYAVMETPQYYEVDGWQGWIGGQIATYEASPWCPPDVVRAIRTPALVLLWIAGGVTVVRRRRDAPTFVAGVWIVGVTALTLALTPLPWGRYYLPALPALYALAAIGIGGLAGSLRPRDMP
jgi:4-amino-4-deoxy-L-arabinose transferase-like glycosyltransferase